MYTLETAKEHWAATGKHGTKAQRIARGKLWMPYYSYIARQQLGKPYTGCAHAARTAAFLLEQGILRDNDRVLDIGAGIGNFDLEFAEHCQEVVALDTNEDALEVLRERTVGRSNIRTLCSTWEEYSSKEMFDVTFSALCPAICNQEELERMESITRRTCCILAVMRGSYEKHRMAMMKALPVVRSGGMATEALTYYNNLYLMGRKPNVKCWSETFTTEQSADSVLEQYRLYFPIFGVDDGVTTQFLKEYLAKEAPEGVLHDECHMNYALIYWNVPEK